MTTTVLVVDDDRDVAESLGMVLEGLDCEVELAFDGDGAMERCRRHAFDLILLDVRLPGRDGVQVFHEMRQLRPECRVAFVTGYSASALLEEMNGLPGVAVLDKPVSLDRLRALLRASVEG